MFESLFALDTQYIIFFLNFFKKIVDKKKNHCNFATITKWKKYGHRDNDGTGFGASKKGGYKAVASAYRHIVVPNEI